MAFLNAMGAVSRHGQWRLQRVLRSILPDGRVDASDAGLIDFSAASEILLQVVPRQPRGNHDPHPVLAASAVAGTLVVSNPGVVEALFPLGWSAHVPAGVYDVRIWMTVGPETALIFDNPVELR
ncbi:hypothetical protein [Methylobacterium aquaticum]|uniref:Uncharacterized protein n=1 Tax=Methylobacterium aquaticum TaxID=270351 RepID=A0A0C6F6K3_9HYPH|nr:hypothetical protein [Methylobacterium aquaticum]BAQ43963.1 hypothetical protein Maq22A_c02415 [Methylobacterium aquaticum]